MRIHRFLLTSLLLLGALACAKQPAAAPATGGKGLLDGLEPGVYAHFVTNFGEFVARLNTAEAPLTTANFIGLAQGAKPWLNPNTNHEERSHFYDGLLFHRVEDGVVIQGGDPLGTGQGGPGYKFGAELTPTLHYDRPGVMGMARTQDPNSYGSQFFIALKPMPDWDGNYNIFGEVVRGMDVLNTIAKVPTFGSSRPTKDVVMKTVRIITVDKSGQRTEGAATPGAPAANAATTQTQPTTNTQPR